MGFKLVHLVDLTGPAEVDYVVVVGTGEHGHLPIMSIVEFTEFLRERLGNQQ